MLAELDEEVGTCRECGNQRSECSDHERVWYPQRVVCFATMERESAQRAYEQLHEDRPYHDGTFKNWGAERSGRTPYHFMDGVSIYTSPDDDHPGDLFTTRVDASPWDEPTDDDDLTEGGEPLGNTP